MSDAGDMIDNRLLMEELKKVGVFKLGSFTLQSGQNSPIYIDLRLLFTSPKVLYDYIVGVPYAALPLSTIIADRLDKPMLLRRGSILETVLSLRSEGLICNEAICVLDREQGGPKFLQDQGITLYSILGMNKMLDFLIDIGTITLKKKEDILYQLTLPPPSVTNKIQYKDDWSLVSRKDATLNCLNKKLLEIMNKFKSRYMGIFKTILSEKTCLCIAIDVTKCEEIIQIIEKTGGYICAVKLHADVIEDFNDAFVQKLTSLANNLDFIIFEDRKLADTGYTTKLQLTKGPFKIESWAQLVSVHAFSGQSVLNIIRKIVEQPTTKLTGVLLVVEMSSDGSFTNSKEYLNGRRMNKIILFWNLNYHLYSFCTGIGKNNRDIVSGFICQKRCADVPSFLYWTAGVHMDAVSDGIGQNWRTVENAIGVDGNDIVVVGRAITGVDDINTQIRRYRDAAWESFINRQQNY
ncbi:Uridine 5'-monophosphate synthase [Dirofilaria immitis]|nr:Uridine 5'-monophosphate synthase [Dirofilaria immitis]